MTNEEALGWFERRAESFTLSDRCQQAEDIAIKAIRALIAQQPRVLTLEEALGGDECWVEFSNGGCGYCDCYLSDDVKTITIHRTLSVTRGVIAKDYGKTWRCWTARPTEEQRKAVKWDG